MLARVSVLAAFIAFCIWAFFEQSPCIRHPTVGGHGEFLANGNFGGFYLFPAHGACWRLVVAQHSERFHRFGIVVHQLVNAVLVAFAFQTDHAVKALVTQEFREVAVVNVNLGTLPKKCHKLAENFRILFHERGELFNKGVNFVCEHV